MPNNCNKCCKSILHHHEFVTCSSCKSNFHTRCIYTDIVDNWLCFNCTGTLFPFNHYLDDDEFKYALFCFDNSIEYNRLLNLRLNPFLYDNVLHDADDNLIKFNAINSCSYILDRTIDINPNCNGDFSILHINPRSFNRNKDAINTYIDNCQYQFSIIAMSETWFNEDDSNIIHIDNYSLVNKPRHGRRSGGAVLYIHNSLTYKVRDDLILIDNHTVDPDHSESVFIEIINPSSKNIIVGDIYRAHKTDTNLFLSDLSNCLTKITNENKECYISGDFNLNLLKHNTEHHINEFLNSFHSHNMFPLIDRPTRITSHSATLVDNIFTNVLTHSIKSGVCVVDITDHFPIFQITNSLDIHHHRDDIYHFKRNFNHQNLGKFSNLISQSNWNHILNDQCPQKSYDNFLHEFTNAYNTSFPPKRCRVNPTSKRSRKPWITPAILKSIHRKDKLYKKYMNKPTYDNKTKLNKYRNMLTSLIRSSKKQYFTEKLNENRNNLKQTWNILNSVLGRNRPTKPHTSFTINGSEISDPTSIADGFNDFFVNIGPNLADKIPNTNANYGEFLKNIPSPIGSLFFSPTNDEEIADVFNTLKTGTACGYDDIKTDVVITVKHIIAPYLIHIFNLSISKGIFPTQLKKAKVTPIHKNGDRNNFSNYRPISVLPVFSKIFERLVYNRLYSYITHHGLLHSSQFGFRKKYSSYMAVLDVYNNIVTSLDKRMHTLGIFLDLSKAFDTIQHYILLDKLWHYGIRGIAHDWFRSYLHERSQYVSYNHCNSSTDLIKCGVPQGSILGPLLFILFINDLPFSTSKLTFFLYADDTNAIASHHNLKELNTIINDELVHISTWFKVNKLSCNSAKTNYMLFKNRHNTKSSSKVVPNIVMDGMSITKVSTTKFLGVTIDDGLTWNNHNNNVANIVSKYSGILYRLKHSLPANALFTIYNTLVLPHLQYCNIIWADANNCKLSNVHIRQKRIIRLCTNAGWYQHSSPLFYKLSTLTVYDIHKLQKAIFMYNFINNNLPVNFDNYFVMNTSIHSYGTRCSNELRPVAFNTNLAINSIRNQGPKLWNGIANDIINSPTNNVFKRKYKRLLLSMYH